MLKLKKKNKTKTKKSEEILKKKNICYYIWQTTSSLLTVYVLGCLHIAYLLSYKANKRQEKCSRVTRVAWRLTHVPLQKDRSSEPIYFAKTTTIGPLKKTHTKKKGLSERKKSFKKKILVEA